MKLTKGELDFASGRALIDEQCVGCRRSRDAYADQIKTQNVASLKTIFLVFTIILMA